MRSYEFCYEVTVDPEDVLDSLSIPQIKEYLICRKTINLNDKDTAVDLELSKWGTRCYPESTCTRLLSCEFGD